MYGTIAKLKAKPGKREALRSFVYAARPPGFVAVYGYQLDEDPDTFYMAVQFEDKESYFANAHSPEQHASYLELRELLAADPEWHDGEITFVHEAVAEAEARAL